ncbi:hypothetical protein PC119_g14784 [Phytophthora cactorum]|uniref:Uncharacterized protein n=1 Tax=Phytophthora cactorum TaxID=29920 RepID=A0A8T1D946_9STRA|nr:hypothetical protein PC114_g19273 [Phytophthora cactorum]KAG2937418.1 hypothetical protein PC115_g4235 [Phytophthora cactorum]KAG3006914.1 hypothetical protein PC119_g14784 [Phytophthora cactorum]
MHVDNQVAIAQIEGEDTAGRAKHIDVRFKFVKDFAKKKVLEAGLTAREGVLELAWVPDGNPSRCRHPTRVAAAAVDRNGPKQFPIFQLAHEVTFQVLRAHSTKRVAQRNKIPRQKKAATAGTHISGRRNNLLCSVALSVVIKACAQAVCESPVKFAVAEDNSNRTLRNVQNQIRNLKKCELGVTTRSHRVKKGLLNFCAVPGNTGRIFVNSSNEKRIATCITLQTKHIVDILTDSRETPACAVNTGYTNLHKHLTKCIGKDYDAKYASAVKARRNGLGFEVIEYVSERDLSVFKWIVGVLMRNMPLSEVDNPLTRELAGISSSDHVSSRSLSTYIKYLVPLVEALVEKIPPLPFGVMLDGWTTKSTHYVAVPEDQSRAVE